jgi:2-polyprenyl-6-methoxyphenol hydroxylase-like FAD-dependent oxidoreductase
VQRLRTVIIGAGMGGLVLAQALARAGDDVSVHDRDAAAAATGGYRLHLDARACAALRRHLAPELFAAIRSSAADPRTFRQFAFTDHRMRVLAVDDRDPGEERLLIGRVPLRTLLCRGIEDRVRFGATFTGFEVRPDERVAVHFADGSSGLADLLVGADGAGSRVARALAGRPTSTPIGISGIAGRTPIHDGNRGLVPALLRRGPALAFGPGGVGLFLTLHDPGPGPTAQPPETEAPALIWGLLADDRRYPDDLASVAGDELVATAQGVLDPWHPAVRELVRQSEAGTAGSFVFRAADPAGDLTPWPRGPVTVLGDAVHAMPPTGGRGAATAIRDADVLAGRLAQVRDGTLALPLALRRFEAEMATYAPAAVAASLGPVRWIRALQGPAATIAARAGFPLASALAGGLRAARRWAA